MNILFSIIILICVVEFQRAIACNTSGDCTSNCNCNSCTSSKCQTRCQGCRTNCCNNCCSCCNNTTTTTSTTTPITPTTSVGPTTTAKPTPTTSVGPTTTAKPTPSTTRPTVSPSLDESNFNINVKNVINTTSDVKIPIDISLKNTNNVVSLLNMTGNSNCTANKKDCKKKTTAKPVIPTTPSPLIRLETEEEPHIVSEDDNYAIQPIIPKPMPALDPDWVRTSMPNPEVNIPDIQLPHKLPITPIYGQPIPYNQLQNVYNQYDQNLPNSADYSQLSRVQSEYPYFGSNYNQFQGSPFSSSYATQGLQSGSWPTQGLQSGLWPTQGLQSGSWPTQGLQSGSWSTQGLQSGLWPTQGLQSGSWPTQGFSYNALTG